MSSRYKRPAIIRAERWLFPLREYFTVSRSSLSATMRLLLPWCIYWRAISNGRQKRNAHIGQYFTWFQPLPLCTLDSKTEADIVI